MSRGRPRTRQVEKFTCQNPLCGKVFERILVPSKPKPKFCRRGCIKATKKPSTRKPMTPARIEAHRRGAHKMWDRIHQTTNSFNKKEFSRRVSDILEVTGRT